MSDIIETARAAGVHPLAMSEEYLGGLQRFAAVFQQEIERLTLNGIHSCHAECQRPVCRLTRERDALLGALRLVQVDCQHLHHEKKDQHALSQPCPVVDRINAAIAKAEGETK